jgi:hypothetical protein
VKISLRERARLVLRVLPFAIVTCVMSTSFVASASAGVVTASSVIRTTKLAIARQASVHVLFVAHSGSPVKTETITADVGRASGTESVVEGEANLAIRLSSTTAYVSGNVSGLTKIFGMSTTDAKRLGKDWESWKAGTDQYADLRTDLTMSSVTALLPKAAGTKLTTRVAGGSRFYVLKWTIAATTSLPQVSNTLMIPRGGSSLPASETARVSTGAVATTTLSKWGERVDEVNPPAAETVASARLSG